MLLRRRSCCLSPVVRRGRCVRLRVSILARFHNRLVYRRRALQQRTAGRIGTLRQPEDIGFMVLAGSLSDLDAACVDALLLYQVRLRVHGTLRSQIHLLAILALVRRLRNPR